MRSCAPLSCGLAMRDRVTRIPSDTHQAESLVSPPRACTQMNGDPLSQRISDGNPYFRKSLENSALTVSAFVSATIRVANT